MNARRKLMAYLRERAEQGLVCETNEVISGKLGLGFKTVPRIMSELAEENRLHIERHGSRRIVTILGTNLRTADPRPANIVLVRPRVAEIVNHAVEVFDIPAKDIVGRSRYQPHVMARQAVCLIARKRGWTCRGIGRALGQRDHSTISHHWDRADYLRSVNPDFARQVAALETAVPLPVERVIA